MSGYNKFNFDLKLKSFKGNNLINQNTINVNLMVFLKIPERVYSFLLKLQTHSVSDRFDFLISSIFFLTITLDLFFVPHPT
jgi:hypothetical protein